ncbi:MAG TPA: hypothetical protein IAC82_11910 [Candidatus Merdivicinus intestinigallinarum]|nr:hypothetical protein [Candidatus Merdivicinus intestinigallinarum]
MKDLTAAKSLLEMIQGRIGCPWLSDLRLGTDPAVLLAVIQTIPADTASLAEWQDALEYLTGEFPGCTAEEVRLQLIYRLTQRMQGGHPNP